MCEALSYSWNKKLYRNNTLLQSLKIKNEAVSQALEISYIDTEDK